MEQIAATWRRLDLRRRVLLVAAVLLTIAAVLSLAQLATRPGMALLYAGLDPVAAGEVLGAVEQMDVVSEVRGDAIYVASSARDRVRLELARDGLPRQGQAGYELLDQLSGFSSTTDMFNAAYWRAKEGELARTVLASPGVRAARVHIAVPGRQPFARERGEPTASVTVTMAGGRLTEKQATAIRYLVALAVADLKPEQVAVIDSRAGMILAPGTDSPVASAATEAADREARLKGEIEQLLAARVGRDRSRVTVAVETDREAETVTEKVIQPDSRVTIHSDTEEITDSSTGSSTGVTVASNLPEGGGTAGDNRSSSRNESRERINYDYSEVQRQRVRQPGAIRRISVAVLVDGITTTAADGTESWAPRPPEELKALHDLVAAAIGFDEKRGDIVTVESMQFRPDATPGALVEVSGWQRMLQRNAMSLIQIGVLALVILVLALTVVRPLLTRRAPAVVMASGPGAAAALPLPDGMRPDGQVSVLTDDGHAQGGALPGPGGAALPAPSGEALRRVIAERPDEATSMLREWLDSTDGEAA